MSASGYRHEPLCDDTGDTIYYSLRYEGADWATRTQDFMECRHCGALYRGGGVCPGVILQELEAKP